MWSKKFFSGFTLKPMKVTYSCKTLPRLTKIFACSDVPEESHHFTFVKQQRAFLKLLVYKSAPEKIQLYPAKCQGTVPSKLLSLMLARMILFWTHMHISTIIDWGPFGTPKMLSITTFQFLFILFSSSPPRAVKAKDIGSTILWSLRIQTCNVREPLILISVSVLNCTEIMGLRGWGQCRV